MNIFTCITIACSLWILPIDAARILGYLVTPDYSDFYIHDSLMVGLAARGHQVYIYSTKAKVNT